MAKTDIDIQVFNEEYAGSDALFQPGSWLKGRATIFTDSDINCKQVTAQLIWHTEGRGTRFQEKVENVALHKGALRAGLPNSFEFEFLLPNDPWSYEGHYVSIVWEIMVDIDVAWGVDIRGSTQFVMRPRLPETT
ncbi:MAG: hypothetical protein R6X34_29650 [Chloroflexota bacterium]|jgi:hypothetical protein